MALTKAQASKIEAKAKSLDNASEGMRLLFDAGYKVADVAKIMDKPYGWVYGVADRHGVRETAAARRTPKAASNAAPRSSASGSARGRKARTASTPATRQAKARKGSEPASASAKVAARLAAKKPGRPTTARRAANRKVKTTA